MSKHNLHLIFMIIFCVLACNTKGQNIEELINNNLLWYLPTTLNNYDNAWIKNQSIKTIVEYHHIIRNNKSKRKQIFRYQSFDKNGYLKEESFCRYQLKNKIEESFEEQITALKKGGIFIHKYEYNNLGKIITMSKTHSTNNQIETTKYKYNINNQTKERTHLKGNQVYKQEYYKYYDNGKLKEFREFIKKNSTHFKTIKRYDQCGNTTYQLKNNSEKFYKLEYLNLNKCLLSNQNIYFKVDTIQVFEKEKKYVVIKESHKYKTQKLYFNQENKLIRTINNSYDRDNNLIDSKKRFFSLNGNLLQLVWFRQFKVCVQGEYQQVLRKIEYEYHKNGYLKSVKEFDEKEKLIKFTEYLIINHE